MFEVWFGLKYPNLLKDKKEFSEFLRFAGMPENFTADDYDMLKLVSEKNRIKES